MPAESAALLAAEELLRMMLSLATGGEVPTADFKRCRKVLMEDPAASSHLPRFVRTTRDPAAFWSFIRDKESGTGSYERRRKFLRDSFDPLLEHLEQASLSPLDAQVEAATGVLDADSVKAAWGKALARRATDSDGAITAARTLLESVCKTILEDRGIEYNDRRDDLPRLYGRVARALRLAPSDHTEEQFRQILGGVMGVVNGLASVRNRDSDSHGKGRKTYRPDQRHAALAVGLAGTAALFLIETHHALPLPDD